ncbi:phage tail protein [Collimonas silvisoli]|uniref:phage tail protein n=1 Tax=Collimonas silvisoli TaxID=2825884 RepID=UPI001B8CA49C|nr:phage tail protein [Collimonas silvisoli]
MSESTSYLRYLPAVYSTQDPGFLAQYLKIFQKILTGIKDQELDGRKGIQELLAAEVIGNLFYPRLSFLFPPNDTGFIPPISGAKKDQETAILTDLDTYIGVPDQGDPLAAYVTASVSGSAAQAVTRTDPLGPIEAWLNDFLIWLGGWVGLVVDNAWSIDKKRTVMAEIMALYRMRGTVQGLKFLVDLLLDLPLTINGVKYDDNGDPQPAQGTLAVTLANPVVPGIILSDTVATAFILPDRYRPGAPVVAGYLPWLFDVQMVLPNAKDPTFILTADNVQEIQALYLQLTQLLSGIKPAASRFVIAIVPSMQLQDPAHATALGVNTLLGEQETTQ